MNGNINTKQRCILAAVAVVIVGMLLYPPWAATGGGGIKMALGYHPPWWDTHGYYASIDLALLLMQLIAVAVVGAVAFILLAGEETRKGGVHQARAADLELPQDPQQQVVFEHQAPQEDEAHLQAIVANLERLQDAHQQAAAAVRRRLKKKQWRLSSVFVASFSTAFVMSFMGSTKDNDTGHRLAMGLITGSGLALVFVAVAALSHSIEFRKAMRAEISSKESGYTLRAALVATVISIAGGVFWFTGTRPSQTPQVATANRTTQGTEPPWVMYQRADAERAAIPPGPIQGSFVTSQGPKH